MRRFLLKTPQGAPALREIAMTRDELNRELRMHSATWQAVVIVYGSIVATLVLSAMAIT